MAGTIFGIPFDSELFIDSWQNAPDPTKTAMINSGALVNDSLIESKIASSGNLYTIPFYNILDGEDQNYDGQTDITSKEIGGGVQSGIVYGRAKSFFARNFTAELSGADPMGAITSSISTYWQKRRQMRLIGLMTAIFGVTGSSGNAKKWQDTHVIDLSSTTAAAYTIKETDLNDVATEALGDNKSEFSLAIMHSNVAKTLENLELLEYWKQTDANGVQRPLKLGTVNGYTVIIDDGVPVETITAEGANKGLKKYSTYLLGNGVIRTANGRVDHPVDTKYDPNKNGGQEELITRMRETLHPNGFSFKVPTTGWSESPTDAQLFATANWSLQFDPKTIPMACLKTNG